MLVGLDEQLLRSTPRVEVLVKRGQVARGTSSAGGNLVIGLPDDVVALPGDDDGTSPPGDDDAGRSEPPSADPLVY
jgi:hypothetical protein